MQKELDAANERFKEYERKDVKLREDIKHLSAKQKKLTDKLAKDTVKAEVSPIPSLPASYSKAADRDFGHDCLNTAVKQHSPSGTPSRYHLCKDATSCKRACKVGKSKGVLCRCWEGMQLTWRPTHPSWKPGQHS